MKKRKKVIDSLNLRFVDNRHLNLQKRSATKGIWCKMTGY